MSGVRTNSFGWTPENVKSFLERLGDVPRHHVHRMFEAMMDGQFSATELFRLPTVENVGLIVGRAPFDRNAEDVSATRGWKQLQNWLTQIEESHFELNEQECRQIGQWQFLAQQAYEYHSHRDASMRAEDPKHRAECIYDVRVALAGQLSMDFAIHAQSLTSKDDKIVRRAAIEASSYWDAQRALNEYYHRRIQNWDMSQYDEQSIQRQFAEDNGQFRLLTAMVRSQLADAYERDHPTQKQSVNIESDPQAKRKAEIRRLDERRNLEMSFEEQARQLAANQMSSQMHARLNDCYRQFIPLSNRVKNYLVVLEKIAVVHKNKKAGIYKAKVADKRRKKNVGGLGVPAKPPRPAHLTTQFGEGEECAVSGGNVVRRNFKADPAFVQQYEATQTRKESERPPPPESGTRFITEPASKEAVIPPVPKGAGAVFKTPPKTGKVVYLG